MSRRPAPGSPEAVEQRLARLEADLVAVVAGETLVAPRTRLEQASLGLLALGGLLVLAGVILAVL